MLSVTVESHRVRIGERFSVSFQRTLRIPDDGREYPLPPGSGAFPLHRVEEYVAKLGVRSNAAIVGMCSIGSYNNFI